MTWQSWAAVAVAAIYFSAASIWLYIYELPFGLPSARGIVFSLIVVEELFMVLLFRALYDRRWQRNVWLALSLFLAFILQLVVTEVPALANLFRIDSLAPLQWAQLLALCLPLASATVLLDMKGKGLKK